MKEFWQELFKLLERLMPQIMSFMLGKRVGEIGKQEITAKRDALKLELERLKNAKTVEENNRGKSDLDVVNDAIEEGLRSKHMPDK